MIDVEAWGPVEPHVVAVDDPFVRHDVGVGGTELGQRTVLAVPGVIDHEPADPEVVAALDVDEIVAAEPLLLDLGVGERGPHALDRNRVLPLEHEGGMGLGAVGHCQSF
nr:hypothetical protein [Microlunatus parietis]